MLKSGFSKHDVEEIREKIADLRDKVPRLASDGSLAESGPEGLLGPQNDTFRTILAGLGVEADDETIDLVRSIYMRATATAYADTARRYPPLSEAQTSWHRTLGDAASSPAPAPTPVATIPTPAPDAKVDRTIKEFGGKPSFEKAVHELQDALYQETA
jgi:hypothetical protein